jgi:hypothetical protein
MLIAWQYLDKKAAAVDALKDYGSMKYIIEHTNEDIYAVESRMTNPRGTVMNGMPSVRNPQSGEEKLTACIDEIDVIKERYRQALEYMSWFNPAWDGMADEERYILNLFFLSDATKTDAVLTIGEELSIERTHVYRRKDKAVDHLALLLYGK